MCFCLLCLPVFSTSQRTPPPSGFSRRVRRGGPRGQAPGSPVPCGRGEKPPDTTLRRPPCRRSSTGRPSRGRRGGRAAGAAALTAVATLQFVGKTFNVHGYLVTVLAERNLGLTWGDRGSSRALGDESSWCDPSSGTPASSGHCGFLARTPAASHLR